jgi:hypothetical protein
VIVGSIESDGDGAESVGHRADQSVVLDHGPVLLVEELD